MGQKEDSSHTAQQSIASCAGISLVGLDGTLYDQVLDFIFYLGLAPSRFSVRSLLSSTNTLPQLIRQL